MKPLTSICLCLIAAASLPLFATDRDAVTVKSSSVSNGVVLIQAEVSNKDTALECFVGSAFCTAAPVGEYAMARANADESIYNDCTNVVLYRSVSGAKETVGVYCWLGSDDCYITNCTSARVETAPSDSIQRSYPAVMDSDYPRWAKAQKYVAIGFKPIDCFGGQVRIRAKRLQGQPFSVYSPNDNMKCCGTLIKAARTDKHGHFLVEPMQEGEYFAKFDSNGFQYLTNFAVIQNYTRCEATHVEINFSDVSKTELQTYADIDDSGKPCEPSEPRCFHK